MYKSSITPYESWRHRCSLSSKARPCTYHQYLFHMLLQTILEGRRAQTGSNRARTREIRHEARTAASSRLIRCYKCDRHTIGPFIFATSPSIFFLFFSGSQLLSQFRHDLVDKPKRDVVIVRWIASLSTQRNPRFHFLRYLLFPNCSYACLAVWTQQDSRVYMRTRATRYV